MKKISIYTIATLLLFTNSYCQKINSNKIIGTWETLDKEPHYFTFTFYDSVNFICLMYGKKQGTGNWTYKLDTWKGNDILITEGKNPIGECAIDTSYIKFISADTIKFHGRFDDNPVEGKFTENQWNDIG